MAAAIGQSINIPIVIRRLAADLHRHVPGIDATLVFDPDFLSSLDSGTDHHDPTKVLETYHNQWWTARKCPPITDLMNPETITDFLTHHRGLTDNPCKDPLPVGPVKPSYGWSRGVYFDSVSANIQCNECRLYRGISIGALDELRDLRHYAHGMEVRFAFRARTAARRAATFYQLYHMASSKADTPQSKAITNMCLTPDQIRVRAQTELVRLSKLPTMKWTPECPLSSKEVLEVLKTNPHLRKVHSGYVEYLPWGRYGASSDAPMSASPHESDRYSDTGKIDEIVELSPKSRPMHFEFPPLRDLHGEPPHLDESAPSIEPAPPAPPKPFYIQHPPTDTLLSVNPIVSSASDSDDSCPDVGPIGAFGYSMAALVVPEQFVPPAGSDSPPDIGPADALGQSFANSDSDSGIEEVTAMEAAAALADSDFELGAGGMVLAALAGGQLAVEVVPPGNTTLDSDGDSESSDDIGPANAFGDPVSAASVDSDLNSESSNDVGPAEAFGNPGSAVSLPIFVDSDTNSDMSCDVGPAEAIGPAPNAQAHDSHSDLDIQHVTAAGAAAAPAHTDSQHMSRPVIPGPFTADWFAPLAPELLCVSSDDEDGEV